MAAATADMNTIKADYYEAPETLIEKCDSPITPDEDDPCHWFTPEEGRKIKHKIDRRLVLVLGAMYCVSLMDRTNLSNAAIAGMRDELLMVGNNRYVSPYRERVISRQLMIVKGDRHACLLRHVYCLTTSCDSSDA